MTINFKKTQGWTPSYKAQLSGTGPGFKAKPPVGGGSPTKLLMHFDGNFNDSSNNGLTFTSSGAATISSDQSKFGGSSLLMQGDNVADPQPYITTNFTSDQINLAADQWCVEGWYYFTNFTSGNAPALWSFNSEGVGETGPYLAILSGANLALLAKHTGGGMDIPVYAGSTNVSLNEWHHVALVKSTGGVFTIYLDGTNVASGTMSDMDVSANKLVIGNHLHYSGDSPTPMNGYIDEFRVTVGSPVYTGNFTPPAAPFAS